MPELHEIIDGDDITAHYLDEDITRDYQERMNETFKIFRYNHEVYAVRYDETDPIDSISMWRSHKGENISTPKDKIGQGEEGTVYGKTPDKAMKVSKGGGRKQRHATETNLEILRQQFVLNEKDIEQHFVLGLWNIKSPENVYFYMPKVESANFNRNNDKPKVEKFILALKEMNDLGYWHRDLANNPFHYSLQNLFVTTEDIKTIDMDAGFAYNDGDYDSRRVVFGRDQWIYVYNRIYPPHDDFDEIVHWEHLVDRWYDEHEGQCLSDHPEELLKMYENGELSLPKKIVNDLHKDFASQGVHEYLSGKVKERKHAREVSAYHFFTSPKHQEAYEGLKGDALKRTILNELKVSLSDITMKDALKKKKAAFLKSPEMEILDRPQGKPTKVLGLKTDSHKAVDKIFKEAEKRIDNPGLKM
ncbi:Dot/Icm T4SS effector [Legionella steelei]|uniref:Dot/Icm T4SS effector n=1 Tax=Legionella steelei TaxID=947033 RepID=A0A0W0ZFS1_9GAMM|nr:hypothetical protein [Legionella steelei]KTD67832.1 Dot/Icm T4SS effector [Legionella steelei]